MHENGNPLLGDSTYFIEGKKSVGNGLYLHAYSLSFQHPISKSDISITAPLPPKFTKIFGQENTSAFTINKISEEEE
jgi:23S rRNA pseudouridine1911/1915/1917 synthase